MTAKLIAEEGDLKGLVFSLEGRESWLIGRDPDECQLVVGDPLTSRKHLIARNTPQGITVENLSTTNPTLVNDEEIQQGVRLLQQGDTIRIGNEVFRFYADPSAHILDNNLDASVEASQQNASTDVAETPAPPFIPDRDNEDKKRDTIFDEESRTLADITFGIEETGRWLLKVIGGPNTGAEFYMQAGHQYILGTDPHACDIVFHDTSVSRQHARLSVTDEDTLFIEDMKSRNGVLISGQPLDGKQLLSPSVIVTVGTSSFVVYDREGEMQTIISPLLPSIVKVLQHEDKDKEVERPSVEQQSIEPVVSAPEPEIVHPGGYSKSIRNIFPFVLTLVLMGLFTFVGMGVYSLFKSEPIIETVEENPTEVLQQALAPFPAVKYSFNRSSGKLLLLGHVLTSADKSQLIYNLQELKFIKSLDDTGIVIDEYVWQEINSVLARNPVWRGITVHSPAAGQFVLAGYLQTRQQAEELADYIGINFPYIDLLKNQVVVEEEVVGRINIWLQQQNLRNVVPKLSTTGEVTLSGSAPSDKMNAVQDVMTKIKEIPQVRMVNNLVQAEAPELGIVNITDRYEVTGYSRLGNGKYTVVINGHILAEGDSLDGMVITAIRPNIVLLEKDSTKYRIDYK